MKIFLIGLPGSGKTVLGKKLAGEFSVPFIDLDQVIEQEAGISVREIFSNKGEDFFRNLEAVALRQQSKVPEFVIACGGGTPCFHGNMDFINESGKSIFINTPIAEIVSRLNTTEHQSRPLLAQTDQHNLETELKALLKKRIAFYNQATHTVTDSTSVTEILTLLKN